MCRVERPTRGICEAGGVCAERAATELPRPPWDIAFRVERNEFRESVTCQVQIVALRGAVE